MNREIKFRAWDKTLERMITASTTMVIRFSGKVTDGATTPDVELMQFTGLKDKNGVEIYEGDIIKGEYADGDAFAPIAVEDMCWLHKMTVLGDAWRRLEANTVEVIGNIHENPDLLETK